MVFTSQIFLFVFFPICFLTYILIDQISKWSKLDALFQKLRIKDIILITFSFGFYSWAFIPGVLRLAVYIVGVYLTALVIDFMKRNSNENKSVSFKGKVALLIFALAVIGVLAYLIYYNYLNFLITVLNGMFKKNIEARSLIAPLGVSFITFSAISYLTDIYRGHATAGSLIDCALYLSFFPKVISGPIVLWKDFQGQIKTRDMSLNFSVDGINRIMIGFGKKVLLADVFGN